MSYVNADDRICGISYFFKGVSIHVSQHVELVEADLSQTNGIHIFFLNVRFDCTIQGQHMNNKFEPVRSDSNKNL